MTDLTPNDLCPQGEHATGDFEPDNLTTAEHERLLLMSEHAIGTPLSPAAQAVKDATQALYGDDMTRRMAWPLDLPVVVAAIHALADQLRLELPLGDTDADAGVFAAHHAITAAILAIATELEGQP